MYSDINPSTALFPLECFDSFESLHDNGGFICLKGKRDFILIGL